MVLAAPAIAALQRRFPESVLLCHPRTLPLALHLFPALRCRAIAFPHLDKQRRLPCEDNPLLDIAGEFELLISLRWDAALGRLVDESDLEYHASGEENFDTHVAVEQRRVVAPFTGHYDLLSSFRYISLPRKSNAACVIGLCISAGHPLNAWPLNHWLELGRRLHERALRLTLLGGPDERVRLRVLSSALAEDIGYAPPRIVGGPDFAAFLQTVANETDLVIATDSGTAHLASLVRPTISLFGGSPWRRYAPLGRNNIVLSRREHCSPCRQFDRNTISTCHSQECLVNLLPGDVICCLERYLSDDLPTGLTREGKVWMLRAPWEEDYMTRSSAQGCRRPVLNSL